jgi:DNA-directed RNA polymerase subunit RPC12/RpoP
MGKCSVIMCQLEASSGMCEECDKKFNSKKYYIYACENCGSVVFLKRRISKDTERIQTVQVCPACIKKHKLPEEEDWE